MEINQSKVETARSDVRSDEKGLPRQKCVVLNQTHLLSLVIVVLRSL